MLKSLVEYIIFKNEGNLVKTDGNKSLKYFMKTIPQQQKYSVHQNNVDNIGTVIWTQSWKKAHGHKVKMSNFYKMFSKIKVNENGHQ